MMINILLSLSLAVCDKQLFHLPDISITRSNTIISVVNAPKAHILENKYKQVICYHRFYSVLKYGSSDSPIKDLTRTVFRPHVLSNVAVFYPPSFPAHIKPPLFPVTLEGSHCIHFPHATYFHIKFETGILYVKIL